MRIINSLLSLTLASVITINSFPQDLKPNPDLENVIVVFKTHFDIDLYWRPLNAEQYQKVPLTHVNRGVYKVTLPLMQSDFEYYIEAESGSGQKLLFPATAPDINQTVIVITE